MADTAALQRLLIWLSPAFPVGGFAWSQGLETAIGDGRIAAAPALRDWLDGSLAHGGLRTDAILLAHAWREHHDAAQLQDLADLALALNAASERHLETTLTGDSFATAARAWPSDVYARLPAPCPYPVAVGAIAGAQQIGLAETLIGYLTTAIHTQISVAVRLVPLGQTAGLQLMAGLEPAIAELAAIAADASLDDIGAIAYAADIAQMRHETIGTRVFRS
ncbi:MAG: urease accessory protein UreF [Hyphomicrobiales bacterium]|nr:MAG: urease accessory protein UreF [Hyphomicrobiales bacterium]